MTATRLAARFTHAMDAPKYIELKPREEVLEVIHASVVPHMPKLAMLVLWSVLPFFFLFPLWRQGTWGVILFLVWLCSGLLMLARAYVRYNRTVFLLTDSRVVDHDQRGLFHRVVTQARYDEIDEASVRIKGIAPTMFGYGTLTLKLHGSSADIVVDAVPRPSHLADVINDLRLQHARP